MKLGRILAIIPIYAVFMSSSYALTLAETIQETVDHNPDILITEKDHSAINEALKQAKAAYLPKVNVHFGYGLDQSRNANTIGDATGSFPTMPKREEGVTLDQMLFDGFATKSDVARNDARVNSAVYKVLSSIEDTAQRDVEVYLGVLRETELLQLAKDNLAFHEKIHHLVELRTKSGVSRLADLYQANGRLSLAQSNVLAELSNFNDARANFFRTVGIPAENMQPATPPDEKYLPTSLEQALEIALRNNPTLKSADADIYAALEQHRVSKAVNLPRLDLQLGAGRDRNVGGQRGPSYDQFAMLRVSYNLYNGGADISKQRETAYQLEQAKDIKERAARQLIETVRLTWDLLTTARSQLEWLKKHQDESVQTVNAYAKQYEIGQRTLLDLLDSQNELFAAQRAYVSGRFDLIQSEYRILRDIGVSVAALNIDQILPDKAYTKAAEELYYDRLPISRA